MVFGMNPPPEPRADWALFLDFDGTLVELREQPGDVILPTGTGELLLRLRALFAGAVAIVSGRTLADLDALLAPVRLPLAGLHGLERRDGGDRLHGAGQPDPGLETVREAVAGFAEARPGLLSEDKGAALAVHYREAPERADEVAAFLARQRATLGAGFHVQAGKAVLELKPDGRDKGDAVRAFMREAPFAGRVPVFIGDDRTDEPAFAAVNALGGRSIRVGGHDEPTAACHGLDSVEAAIAWLAVLPDAIAGSPDTDLAPGPTP
jgi:trehalose 6-phosphate phosphatase